MGIVLNGFITPEGKLEVDLPQDMPSGPVEIEIRQADLQGITLGQLLDSGLVGLWADREDIGDSVDFARKLRRRASRREE
jgi:hypothetical protein